MVNPPQKRQHRSKTMKNTTNELLFCSQYLVVVHHDKFVQLKIYKFLKPKRTNKKKILNGKQTKTKKKKELMVNISHESFNKCDKCHIWFRVAWFCILYFSLHYFFCFAFLLLCGWKSEPKLKKKWIGIYVVNVTNWVRYQFNVCVLYFVHTICVDMAEGFDWSTLLMAGLVGWLVYFLHFVYVCL